MFDKVSKLSMPALDKVEAGQLTLLFVNFVKVGTVLIEVQF
jgi:hypothetical protein